MCLWARSCGPAGRIDPRFAHAWRSGADRRNLAKARGVSVNRLIDELATVALTQHDSETRFRVLAARGSKREGLALLDKLDRAFATER